jgi:hypothetical protein
LPAERAQELFHRLHVEIEVRPAAVLDTIPAHEGA